MLPLSPEEVTVEWMSNTLGQRVKTVEYTGAIHTTASKLFVTVKYEDEKEDDGSRPAKLCIKGGFTDMAERFPWIILIYQREVEFFNRIAPTLKGLELPKCWWASSDAKQGIVVMDDLNARGFTFGDPQFEWSIEKVLASVEQLAVLHAGTWGVRAEDYPWLTADYEHAILSLADTYEQTINSPGRPQLIESLTDQSRVIGALKKHFRCRDPRFRCLLHGDTHTGNTFINPSGSPGFLDWQMIHIGSAFHDVAYFVTGALSVDNRRKHEGRIIDHYLTCLGNLRAPNFSRDEVMVEYRKSLLAGIGWIMAPDSMQSMERTLPMIGRYVAAMDDHKTIELIESVPDTKSGS
ncbi:uncharacterized protein JN550_001344 [Neoarthrinium moseri]|uniref:uncharacterized protein n=1 Tax=Neoarthrinium moseri TaxID=1658444 RepID=UPI001FDBCBE1|nr:uncharacterized protein JN550_001344 [Neoarthrinium moseri]KAI1877272.1 hypothetical protein JN550_001344 [Neoarthrinium moseri]